MSIPIPVLMMIAKALAAVAAVAARVTQVAVVNQ
jgi:hypothetical protein